MKNVLYHGDNLEILKNQPDNSVDLVYIDPPFFSGRNYLNTSNEVSFEDKKSYFESNIKSGKKGLDAYLDWMGLRFIEIHRILKPTGSFYLHLDSRAVHYCKVILDSIFGYNNFSNEIVWQRKKAANASVKARRFGTSTDYILHYTKDFKKSTFEPRYTPYDPKFLKKNYRYNDNDGRGFYAKGKLCAPSYEPNNIYDYKGYKPHGKGWVVRLETMKELDRGGHLVFPKERTGRIARKKYLDKAKGMPVSNLWVDINNIGISRSSTGYPTQKPIALLERIISASSKPGDIVLDCFAGSGTTLHAAHNLGRSWIGVDASDEAISIIKKRMNEAGSEFTSGKEPT